MSKQSNRVRAPMEEHLREFEETGLMHLRGAIGEDHVRTMRDRLWRELLDKHRIRRDDQRTWPEGRVWDLSKPRRDGAFAAMQCPPLCAALEAIFTPDGWHPPARWGCALVTFPSHGGWWDVTKGWHLDTSGHEPGQQAPREVTVFAYLDTVGPEGGGTLAVLGSHRVLQKLTADTKGKVRSENGRRMLALADPWLRDLSSEERSDSRKQRFMEEGAMIDGVPLKVVEITGEPGDVVVMHPCTLHGASMNCSEKPRLVVRESVFRSTVAKELFATQSRSRDL